MDKLEQAILIGLAGWRVANLLIYENGPFDIFEKLRTLVGLKPGEISGFFPKLFSCIWCMSVWTVFGAYILWLIFPIGVILLAAMSIALSVDNLVKGSGS